MMRAVIAAGMGQRNSSVYSRVLAPRSQDRRICSLKARLPDGERPALSEVRTTVWLGFARTTLSAATLVRAYTDKGLTAADSLYVPSFPSNTRSVEKKIRRHPAVNAARCSVACTLSRHACAGLAS